METTSGRKVAGGKWSEREETTMIGDDEPGWSRRGPAEGQAKKVDLAQNGRSGSQKQQTKGDGKGREEGKEKNRPKSQGHQVNRLTHEKVEEKEGRRAGGKEQRFSSVKQQVPCIEPRSVPICEWERHMQCDQIKYEKITSHI